MHSSMVVNVSVDGDRSWISGGLACPSGGRTLSGGRPPINRGPTSPCLRVQTPGPLGTVRPLGREDRPISSRIGAAEFGSFDSVPGFGLELRIDGQFGAPTREWRAFLAQNLLGVMVKQGRAIQNITAATRDENFVRVQAASSFRSCSRRNPLVTRQGVLSFGD